MIAGRWELQTGRDQDSQLSCGGPATPFSCLQTAGRLCFEPHFMILWNHSQNGVGWKYLKDHLVPTLLPWAEPPSIRTVCSGPHATWPGTTPGIEILAHCFYGFCPTAFTEGLVRDFTALIFGNGLLISRLNLFIANLYLLHLCLVCSLALLNI